MLAMPAAAGEARTSHSIEVVGEGRSEVVADLALLDFGVVSRGATAGVAARENGARMERVIAALRKVMGSDASLGTGTYSIRPLYASVREQESPRITGYEVSNTVHLRTRSMARVGEAIDVAIEAGANQVQRLVFTLGDDTEARRTALSRAARQAREKAQTLAGALGLKLGAVRSLVEQDAGVVRPVMRQAAMAEAAAFTPVEPGLVDVRARVVLTMDIADSGAAP
jgi:uncharacterized protein YggE